MDKEIFSQALTLDLQKVREMRVCSHLSVLAPTLAPVALTRASRYSLTSMFFQGQDRNHQCT